MSSIHTSTAAFNFSASPGRQKKIELGIVCVAVMEPMRLDYMTDICSVDEEEERIENGALRNTIFDLTRGSGLLHKLH